MAFKWIIFKHEPNKTSLLKAEGLAKQKENRFTVTIKLCDHQKRQGWPHQGISHHIFVSPSPAEGSQELCSTSSRLLIIFEILQEHEVVVHILRSSMIICLDCESVKEHKQEALAFNDKVGKTVSAPQ